MLSPKRLIEKKRARLYRLFYQGRLTWRTVQEQLIQYARIVGRVLGD